MFKIPGATAIGFQSSLVSCSNQARDAERDASHLARVPRFRI